MSDPPKKLGSLKDRIAAFENKGSVPAPAPAPAPRPKPASAASWKPKPLSPPASPKASVDHAERKAGGMSAADAKESITKGGSLKDRMAALQGRGGFTGPGGSPPPVAPKPAEKPKWKPPPVVSPPSDNEDEVAAAPKPPAVSPPVSEDQPEARPTSEGAEVEASADVREEGEGEEKEVDPQEEERQRRAAIAARMARLGGARVGMGPPPVFGKKPEIKRTESAKSKEDEAPKLSPPAKEAKEESEAAEVGATSEEVKDVRSVGTPVQSEETSQDYFATSNASESSLLSADSGASSVKSPSMPVPAGPRRAAPPRKKAAKSPSPAAPQPVLDDGITESPETALLLGDNVQPEAAAEAARESRKIEETGSREPELVGSAQAEALINPENVIAEGKPGAQTTDAHTRDVETKHTEPATEPIETSTSPTVPITRVPESQAAESESTAFTAEPEDGEHAEATPSETEVVPKVQDEAAIEEEEEEEDEATRRKRIADRLAKSGGFNPFSGLPPTRQPSTPSTPVTSTEAEEPVEPPISPPPAPVRRQSTRKASTDSATQLPIRRTSIRSIDSTGDESSRSPPAIPTSPKPEMPTRKGSTASVGSDISLPTRKMSQDDHKPILHESVPHHRQPSISEEIYEEPESEGAENELVSSGNEEPAAAHDVHEESSASMSTGRRDSSARFTHDRPVSFLRVEDEGEKPVEDSDEHDQEYEPPESDRASSPTSAYDDEEEEVGIVEQVPEPDPEPIPPRRAIPYPPSKRASVPPPPKAIPSTPDVESSEDLPRRSSDSRRSIPSPFVPPPPIAPELDDLPRSAVPRSSVPKPAVGLSTLKSPPPKTKPPSPPPPVPRLPEAYATDTESDDAEEKHSPPLSPVMREDNVSELDIARDSQAPAPPLPPPHTRSSIPVPVFSPQEVIPEPAVLQARKPPARSDSLSKSRGLPLRRHVPTPLAVTEPEEQSEREVLGDEDGDPIDPSFHSPVRSTGQPPSSPQVSSPLSQLPVIAPTVSEEGEGEQDRRRTIAERMAKLGGIRFGAPLPMPSRAPAPASRPEEATEDKETEDQQEVTEEPPEEEDEFARKQRIAARLAGMGGMRFGMVPTAMSPPPPVASPSVTYITGDDGDVLKSPPVAPKVPSVRAPAASTTDESEGESVGRSVSDEGVHVEAEESEIEEVNHEDAQEEAPPVPSRPPERRPSVLTPGGRAPPVPPSFSRPPSVPFGRPPIPGPSPSARSSASPVRPPPPRQATVITEEPASSAYLSPAQPVIGPPSPNDYVMVEPENFEEPPPPPPARSSRAPPPRAAPPPPAPPADMLAQSSWELPQIPSSSLDFGAETDMSSSGQWSEVPSQNTAATQRPSSEYMPLEPARRRSSQISGGPQTEVSLSSDELMAQWGRVGVQIHEVAATLFDKSKKVVIGDGSYVGFIAAVLSHVPNASPPSLSYDSFGYLIYSQAGSAVQRRASDIMPGDIIMLHDAKLKGHKGLQMYHQTVGAGEPLFAIVADFEMKRSKVKVFQANQHVGQQSVESASYRLEDVKSGTIKIYRVLEK